MQTHCVAYELIPADIGGIWREVFLPPGILEFIEFAASGQDSPGNTPGGSLAFRIPGSKTDRYRWLGVDVDWFPHYLGNVAFPQRAPGTRYYFGIDIAGTNAVLNYRSTEQDNSSCWLSIHYRDVILDTAKRSGVTE